MGGTHVDCVPLILRSRLNAPSFVPMFRPHGDGGGGGCAPRIRSLRTEGSPIIPRTSNYALLSTKVQPRGPVGGARGAPGISCNGAKARPRSSGSRSRSPHRRQKTQALPHTLFTTRIRAFTRFEPSSGITHNRINENSTQEGIWTWMVVVRGQARNPTNTAWRETHDKEKWLPYSMITPNLPHALRVRRPLCLTVTCSRLVFNSGPRLFGFTGHSVRCRPPCPFVELWLLYLLDHFIATYRRVGARIFDADIYLVHDAERWADRPVKAATLTSKRHSSKCPSLISSQEPFERSPDLVLFSERQSLTHAKRPQCTSRDRKDDDNGDMYIQKESIVRYLQRKLYPSHSSSQHSFLQPDLLVVRGVKTKHVVLQPRNERCAHASRELDFRFKSLFRWVLRSLCIPHCTE